MAPISELLEDPYTLDEVVIEVVKQMQKAPISALEPHVGMLVRVLERNWAQDMELHRYVGAFLQRLPMHWLAPHFSHIMRAPTRLLCECVVRSTRRVTTMTRSNGRAATRSRETFV